MHKYKTHVKNKTGLKTPKSAEDIIKDLLEQLFSSSEKKNYLIAVGGPGGTGKSTFCRRLKKILPNSEILKLDDYKTNREIRSRQNIFGPHPDANKIQLIHKHLSLSSNGMEFDKPVYNPETGAGDLTEKFKPAKYNIIDGEIATYREFRDIIDFSIFIDSDWKTQLNTRIFRDINERNYSKDKAITTFLQSNLREFAKYGAESKNWADVHVYCHDDYQLMVESVSQDIYHHFESLLERYLAVVDLSGLIVAVPTPFNISDKVDQENFIKHLEFLNKHGVERILVNGTTGEFFSLTKKEHKLILSLARRYFPGVVVFHVGNSSLAQTLEEVKSAEEYGADAILVSAPFYYAHAPEKGLIDYFKKVEAAATTPLIIYNFPEHTHNPITPEIINNVNHFALKDSSSDFDLIQYANNYYVADERLITQAYKAGAYGFISGYASCRPELFVSLEQAVNSNDTQEINRSINEINEFLDVFTACEDQKNTESNIPKIKYGLSKRISRYPDDVRLPLLNLDNITKKKLETK
jgi:4-hydroxy-tetrahydrodipicolinate synthase